MTSYTKAKPWRICLFTGSRSEFGLLEPLCRVITVDPDLKLTILASGMHLSPAFGETWREIEEAGYQVDEKVLMLLDADSGSALAQSVGLGLVGMTPALERLAPDAVVCMGDRFELLALGSACTLLGIPIAHISGGEITEGAMDDAIRHAMTKLSHLHYVANQEFAKRVISMGEEAWRVEVSGEPGLDYLNHAELLSRETLEDYLGLDLSLPTGLITFHPVTREGSRDPGQIDELIKALEQAGLQYVITHPNADQGNREIADILRAFAAADTSRRRMYTSLGRLRYTSLLQYVRLMIGNSSSGLVESPSFNLPTVNVGDRQTGRPQAANVFQTNNTSRDILAGIEKALAYNGPKPKNPFGEGKACQRIKSHLKEALASYNRQELLRKRFIDA